MIIGAYGYWRVRRWPFRNLTLMGAAHITNLLSLNIVYSISCKFASVPVIFPINQHRSSGRFLIAICFQNTTVQINNETVISQNLADNPNFSTYQLVYGLTVPIIMVTSLLRGLIFTKVSSSVLRRGEIAVSFPCFLLSFITLRFLIADHIKRITGFAQQAIRQNHAQSHEFF